MKYLKIILLLFLLSGCTRVNLNIKEKEEVIDDKNKIVKCFQNDDMELLLFAKGDEIEQFQERFKVSFDELGIHQDMDHDEMVLKINSMLDDKYSSLNGVKASCDVKEDYVEICLMIDYTIADMYELIENGLLESGEKESQYISLSQSMESYDEQNFVCEFQ